MTNKTNAELDPQINDQEQRAGEQLLDKVHAFLGRFVSYPDEHAHVAHTLWCVHAHLMHLWDSTPRLAFLSPEPASGKSRALEITKLLVPSPVQAINVSPTYIFRKVGKEGEGSVTLLYDEIDCVFGPKAKDNEDTRALLNAGHRRGAVAGRCVVRGTTVETEEIPAYAALAVAGLGWLPDTLMTRSVIIRMRPRHTSEKIESYRPRLHDNAGHAICISIRAWAETLSEIETWPELPHQIQDRDADVWEPLIFVADAAGGRWEELARNAAVSLVSAGKEMREASLGIRLLTDLKTVFGDSDALGTKVLLQKLIALEESPWSDLHGKPLNDRGLAYRLRQYSIESHQVRVSDNVTLKGYRRADFTDAWKRYVPPPPPRTSETREQGKQSPQEWGEMFRMFPLFRSCQPQRGRTPTIGASTSKTKGQTNDLRDERRTGCPVQERPKGEAIASRLPGRHPSRGDRLQARRLGEGNSRWSEVPELVRNA
jgi:hypothetical protein